ncbi:MAG: dihydroorotase [Gammaproteobacteria bacterium]|nr:MAG: dihydroorotase [Gammaproteobacteria bacterium]
MKISIINGQILNPVTRTRETTDLHIAEGKIVGRESCPEGFIPDLTLDAKNKWILPGLTDLQARCREPGHEHKGTLSSETHAAAANGVTTLCCPPDTLPIIDSPSVANLIQQKAREAGKAEVLPIGALTTGLNGTHLSEMEALLSAGCIGVSNASQPIENLQILYQAMQYAHTFGLPIFVQPCETTLARHGSAHQGPVSTRLGLRGIPACAETIAIATMLELAEATGVTVHFGQISTAKGVEMLHQAKQRGLPISFDIAMHQLFLIDNDLLDFNANCHVLPPLRSQQDRNALRHAVKQGWVDTLCSDHQPHEAEAKLAPFAATEPGISSLDTLLPLAIRLAEELDIDFDQILPLLTLGPARILDREEMAFEAGQKANLALVDPDHVWNLTCEGMASQGKNSPFLGWEFTGQVTHTLLEGHIVFQRDPAAK